MKKHKQLQKKLFFHPETTPQKIVNVIRQKYEFTPPRYYELNGRVAKVEPTIEGGMNVTVPAGLTMADFFMYGTKITKKEYDKLLKRKLP